MNELEVNPKCNIPTMKYKKNNDFETIRMNIIGMLNAYDWQDKVIDNTEQVKASAIQMLENGVKEAQELVNDYKEAGLTINTIEAEGYLRGCITCLNNIKEWL